MKESKKFISLLIALQLFGSTFVPAYAENDEAVTFNETYIASSDEPDNEGASKDSDRVIIKFKDDKTKEKFKKSKNKKIKNKVKGEKDFKVKNKHYSVVTVNEDEDIDEFIQSIGDEYSEEIEMIQPDYLIGSFSNETAAVVENVDIVEETVTDVETTETDVVVAVIDTAIDYDHEALVDSIYANSQEVADGIDNDENGYVDDVIGWDFINGADISQSELTSNHGTHVSGLIAAEGIGAGTNAKILPLNVFNDGLAYTSDIIAAIEYAENAGAKIVNCSWGSTADNPALEEAISNSDMLFVCAVGNSGANIDETPIYPASYDLDNIISVGASNDRDYLAYFSNYGENVDIAANGYKVYSTFANDNYGSMMGTSMSTAYVSGVAAAVYSDSAVATKNIILNTSDRISSLVDLVNGARRINYDNAMLGIENDTMIENTNIDYDTERINGIINSSENFELYDLDPEPVDIYAGSNHSVVVNNWGMVNTYGDNTYNQLGQVGEDALEQMYNTVTGLSLVSEISTFADHNLALMDGAVYAWGRNDRYQLGHTNGSSNAVPTQVEFFNEDGTVPTIVDVEAGGWFSMALDSEGNLWAWGDNTYGQIAAGYTGYRLSTPRIIMSEVTDISAGKYHALAVKNGEVYGWGRNAEDYPLTDAAAWSQSTPIQISGLTGDICGIEAGDRCSFFITSDGVYVLGLNNTGQLGDGTTTTRNTPTAIDITDVQYIESNGSTLFMCDEGTVYACGANNYGQMGQGYVNTRVQVPAKIPGENYDHIATGGYHNLLFKCNEEYGYDEWYFRNATIYAIGSNANRQSISYVDEQFVYPTSVYEITNTEDTGEFAWDNWNLRPIDATYVSQNDTDSTENFYGEDTLKVRYTGKESGTDAWGEYSYLKFDVSEIPKERITSAKLHLYVENEGDMRESTREIGVYDTYENDWNGQEMTWSEGRERARDLLGSFTVTATGYAIEWNDIGWHEVDITDYLKNNCIDDELSLMLKMVSTQAHETVITSGVYNDEFTFQDMVANKNIPVLEIECSLEEASRTKRVKNDVIEDAYISQHDTEYSTNFSDSEYLYVNYTPVETNNDKWGQNAYLSFDIGKLSAGEKENIDSAKLWLYVDKNSDIRDSQRKIDIFANCNLNYDASIMTWEDDGALEGEYNIGTFYVEGNGYEVIDPGWRQIDITEFLKNTDSSEIEFVLRMTSETQHSVKIRSDEYSDEYTRPVLMIDFKLLQSNTDFMYTENDNYGLFETNKTMAYTFKGSDYVIYDNESQPIYMVNSKYETLPDGTQTLVREYNLEKDKTYIIYEKNPCNFSIKESISSSNIVETIYDLNEIKEFEFSSDKIFEFIAPEKGIYEMYTDNAYMNVYYYNEDFEALNTFVADNSYETSTTNENDSVIFELNKGDRIYFRFENIFSETICIALFEKQIDLESISHTNTLIYNFETNKAYKFIPSVSKAYTYVVK